MTFFRFSLMSKHNTIRFTVDLNREDVNWFRAQYPKASMQGILETLFSTFRQVNETTAKDYIENAAQKLSEEMRR